jgi:hypothetical protein
VATFVLLFVCLMMFFFVFFFLPHTNQQFTQLEFGSHVWPNCGPGGTDLYF